MNSVHLLQKTKNGQKCVWLVVECRKLDFLCFRERRHTFSLDFWLIQPLDFFGARRKVPLRGEGNAWAPVLRSFDKLRKVGVLSYLFYPLFKCFVMLVLV